MLTKDIAMLGSKPKRQHWVPQSYQKNFATAASRANNKPQVYLLDKESADQQSNLVGVQNVCVRQHLYSPPDEEGMRDWALEEALSKVEGRIAPRWAEFYAGTPDLEDDALRAMLAVFIATLHLRNTSIEDRFAQVISLRDKLYGPKVQEAGRSLYASSLPKALGDSVDRTFPFDANDPSRAFVQTVWSRAEHIKNVLLAKDWAVLCIETDAFFTTDKPVIFVSDSGRPAGPGTSGAITVVPISPRRLLVMGGAGSVPRSRYIPIEERRAAVFGAALWSNANRFVIGNRPLAEVRRGIDEALR